jgi:hypothetical protein
MHFRLALPLALFAMASVAAPAHAQSKNPAGASLGAALWAEIGGSRCGTGSDARACTSGLNRVYFGGAAAFDLDLLHWLRLGLSAGLGYSAADASEMSTGERSERLHWFVPFALHTYWRVELGNHITLWGGPEVGLGLHVDTLRQIVPGQPTEVRRTTLSGVLAGVGVGLDVRLRGPLRLGLEIGQAVLLEPGAAHGDDLDLRAVTRFALLLRYL